MKTTGVSLLLTDYIVMMDIATHHTHNWVQNSGMSSQYFTQLIGKIFCFLFIMVGYLKTASVW